MIYNMTVAPFNYTKSKGYWQTDGQVTWFTKYIIPLSKDKSWSHEI